MAGMTLIDWVGLVVPFVVYLLLLVVYFVWEGRRERRLREEYGDETATEGRTDG